MLTSIVAVISRKYGSKSGRIVLHGISIVRWRTEDVSMRMRWEYITTSLAISLPVIAIHKRMSWMCTVPAIGQCRHLRNGLLHFRLIAVHIICQLNRDLLLALQKVVDVGVDEAAHQWEFALEMWVAKFEQFLILLWHRLIHIYVFVNHLPKLRRKV